MIISINIESALDEILNKVKYVFWKYNFDFDYKIEDNKVRVVLKKTQFSGLYPLQLDDMVVELCENFKGVSIV